MIVVYHKNNKIEEVVTADNQKMDFGSNDTIALGLHKLALSFPDKKIVWCHLLLKSSLDLEIIPTIFHHKKMMLSYFPEQHHYFDRKIGYVEESPFIKVNKSVSFPTWQMSSLVGVVHAELVLSLKKAVPFDKDFDYFLSSMAKLTMPLGLLCYSEPRLLKNNAITEIPIASIDTLFRFVKQHYRTRWVFLLLLNLMVYERKFPVVPLLFSLFYKNRNNGKINLEKITVQSSKKVIDKKTLDVIIPTIGRKEYLYEVLKDLKVQSRLPTNVIVVEQNPDEGSRSELDYLTNEIWPFTIKHTFTHQAGACNARNMALEQITSEWVFFADDDIRFDSSFIQETFEQINKYGLKAVSISCLQKGEKQIYHNVFQWESFGSGCSFAFTDSLKDCKFNEGYEFGFGEDSDFGMQLRNQGHDVLFLPKPQILHLKAPMGGFRNKPVLQWQNDSVQPKPSPTVLLYQMLHHTTEQIRGYKTILFFKYYKHQKIKNPISYYLNFQKQWERSIFWANQLKQ